MQSLGFAPTNNLVNRDHMVRSAVNVSLAEKTLRLRSESVLLQKDALEVRNFEKLRSFDFVRSLQTWHANPPFPLRRRQSFGR